MKHLTVLKTLGVATCAAIMLPVAAVAQIQTYYHAGTWDAFSGRNDKGGAVCGVGSTSPTDSRRLSLRFDIGGTNTILTASKPSWAIPDGKQIAVVMQIGLNTPWTEQGNGHSHSVSWVLDSADMKAFTQQFSGASSMTLTFPTGSEPPWTVSLTGSSAINATFARCVTDLTRQVQAAKAAGTTPAPATAQSTTQPATQPFKSSANDTQPSAGGTTPANQANGTQVSGTTQTGGTLQSDGTMAPAGTTPSDGTQPVH